VHHRHGHEHHRDHGARSRTLRLEREVLEKNAQHARANRSWLAEREVVAINLLGSPGSGKTTLLEATAGALGGKLPLSVIEGDQETDRDAARVRAAGIRALQLNTGTGCHLDARSVGHALEDLDPPPRSMVVVENVGNLVCPALFDLGERAKVVVLSVTEGEDKPLKYPHVFRASDVLVLTKTDLLPYLRFDIDRCIAHARELRPTLTVLPLSATTGQGMDAWCAWLEQEVESAPRPVRDLVQLRRTPSP
jgi:hydrogenase nickel incorporation protein HypB